MWAGGRWEQRPRVGRAGRTRLAGAEGQVQGGGRAQKEGAQLVASPRIQGWEADSLWGTESGCYFMWLLLEREMSGRGTGLRRTSLAPPWKWGRGD